MRKSLINSHPKIFIIKKVLKLDLLFIFILTILAPLFFYKLGQSSLVSWDEAWYADISRYIVKTGDLFNLVFNGSTFTDKPPGGFWIEAAFFKFFGISELTARLPSAISGLLSLYLVYLIGSKLFNRVVGFTSAVALSSSFWFLFRARSGNLDSILVLFYLLTIYLALLASENKKFFYPFSLSLAFLPMIKGVVFIFATVPSLVLIFWGSKLYKLKDFFVPLFAVASLFGVWAATQFIRDPVQTYHHFSHSLRGSSLENNFSNSLRLFKEYLHNGIGKWFWPGILGAVLGLIVREKRFVILALFFILYSLQFLFSQELHIWHLIPLHPVMILLFFGASFVFLQKLGLKEVLVSVLLVGFAGYFSFLQLRTSWYQFIDIPAFVSDEAILAKEAGKYPEQLLIDGDFVPAATFYSGKQVRKIWRGEIADLLLGEPILLITNDWRLDEAKVPKERYQIIKKDRDKVLIKTT